MQIPPTPNCLELHNPHLQSGKAEVIEYKRPELGTVATSTTGQTSIASHLQPTTGHWPLASPYLQDAGHLPLLLLLGLLLLRHCDALSLVVEGVDDGDLPRQGEAGRQAGRHHRSQLRDWS